MRSSEQEGGRWEHRAPDPGTPAASVVSSGTTAASWALTRRQMPRVRRRLVVHHPQDICIHRVHAHYGRQLQQALLAVPRPHGVERVVADLWRLQQLPPEANDERLVRRQAVQRPVRVNSVERLLARGPAGPAGRARSRCSRRWTPAPR